MRRFPREVRRSIAAMAVLILAVIGLLAAWVLQVLPPRELVLAGSVVAIVFGAQELISWDNWAAALVGLTTLVLGGWLFTVRDSLPSVSLTKLLLAATVIGLFSDMLLHFRRARDEPSSSGSAERGGG